MAATGVKDSNRCLKDLDVSSKMNVLIKQGSNELRSYFTSRQSSVVLCARRCTYDAGRARGTLCMMYC